MIPSLFDEFPPEEDTIRSYSLSSFDFLNRTKDPNYASLRDIIDDWFIRFPEKGRADLSTRFRSSKDIEHLGAFFELLIHELHIKLDVEILTHFKARQRTSKVPDFFITDPSANSSYVEATVVTGKSKQRQAAEARLDDIVRTLNRLIVSPNYWLSMERRGLPRAPASAKRVAQEINRNLAALDNSYRAEQIKEVDPNSFPKWNFSLEGCQLTFQPFPKGDFARGRTDIQPIALQMGEFEKADHRRPIRKAVTKKANRYGTLDLPFVVALNCAEMVDDIDIMEALFGQEQFLVPFGLGRELTSDDIVFSRKRDGVWTNPIGPRYSRVSAVLVATGLRTWSIRDATFCLYHNPWADYQYSSVLTRLNQAKLLDGVMQRIEGERLVDILLPNTSYS